MGDDQIADPGPGAWLIKHGWDVYGKDGARVGEVDDVRNNYLVVGRGFLFTSERYIPVSAIQDVADSCVYLNVAKDEIETRGWDVAPTADPSHMDANAGPTSIAGSDLTTIASENVPGPQEGEGSTASTDTRQGAMQSPPSPWQQEPGMSSQHWEEVEPSYRFGYDMASDSRYRSRDWDSIQPDMRREWLARHPDKPWDDVEAEIRSAWENATRD